MTMAIRGIQPDQLVDIWPAVQPLIDSACDQNEWSAAHVLADLNTQKQQLWVVESSGQVVAAVTSQINTLRNGTRELFNPTLAGAGMDDWLGAVVDLMSRFARTHGCTRLTATGRRGWVRALKQHGARESSVTVALEV